MSVLALHTGRHKPCSICASVSAGESHAAVSRSSKREENPRFCKCESNGANCLRVRPVCALHTLRPTVHLSTWAQQQTAAVLGPHVELGGPLQHILVSFATARPHVPAVAPCAASTSRPWSGIRGGRCRSRACGSERPDAPAETVEKLSDEQHFSCATGALLLLLPSTRVKIVRNL